MLDDREFGPVPTWLSEIVDAALRDLQQPRALKVLLSYDPRGHVDGGVLLLREAGEQGAAGFWVPDGERPTEMLVRFADWLQEQFFPETRGAWGQARPACPGHPHPAHPVELDGEPWWTCPDDGRRIAMIGGLGD